MGSLELFVLVLVVLAVVTLVGLRRNSVDTWPGFAAAVRVPVPADLQSRVRALCVQFQQIQAVKELREALGLSLLDAKNVTDAIAAGNTLPTPEAAAGRPRRDLAPRIRELLAAGRQTEAVRLVAAETGMTAPEADAFIRALQP